MKTDDKTRFIDSILTHASNLAIKNNHGETFQSLMKLHINYIITLKIQN